MLRVNAQRGASLSASATPAASHGSGTGATLGSSAKGMANRGFATLRAALGRSTDALRGRCKMWGIDLEIVGTVAAAGVAMLIIFLLLGSW